MKFNRDVTSSRRKCRKAHFTASSGERRIIMSAPLSKELQKTYSTKRMPVRKHDQVRVVRGKFTGTEGKVVTVFRKKFVIYIEGINKAKSNTTLAQVGIHPSNVVITAPHIDKYRTKVLRPKATPQASLI